ncbi:MAG: hypothetical protein AB8H79_18715 [Myxococcota bacterium]
MLILALVAVVRASTGGVLGPADTVAEVEVKNASAVPGRAVTVGRIGGLPSVRIDILTDRILVGEQPSIVLENGGLPDTGEFLVRPIYERLSELMGSQLQRGAKPPFVAIFSVDSRVPMGTLERVFYTAHLAGVRQVALKVKDRSVAHPWTATHTYTAAEGSAPLTVTVSSEGFTLDGLDPKSKALRRAPSLTCTDCSSIDELPWDGLNTILGRVAGTDAVSEVTLVVGQADLPTAAFIRTLDAVRNLGVPVALGPLSAKPFGGAMELAATPEPLSWTGRVEVVSAMLPMMDAVSVDPIPPAEMERVFFDNRNATQACLNQSRGQPGEVIARVEIRNDGKIGGVAIVENTFALSSVGPCLDRVLRAIEFPPHRGEDVFVVRRSFEVRVDE